MQDTSQRGKQTSGPVRWYKHCNKCQHLQVRSFLPGRQGCWRPDVNPNRAKRMCPRARPSPGSPIFSFPRGTTLAEGSRRPRSPPAPRQGPAPPAGGERGDGPAPLPPPPARRAEEEDARELLPPFPGEDAGAGAACP